VPDAFDGRANVNVTSNQSSVLPRPIIGAAIKAAPIAQHSHGHSSAVLGQGTGRLTILVPAWTTDTPVTHSTWNIMDHSVANRW
jgi:hypothetical protein